MKNSIAADAKLRAKLSLWTHFIWTPSGFISEKWRQLTCANNIISLRSYYISRVCADHPLPALTDNWTYDSLACIASKWRRNQPRQILVPWRSYGPALQGVPAGRRGGDRKAALPSLFLQFRRLRSSRLINVWKNYCFLLLCINTVRDTFLREWTADENKRNVMT